MSPSFVIDPFKPGDIVRLWVPDTTTGSYTEQFGTLIDCESQDPTHSDVHDYWRVLLGDLTFAYAKKDGLERIDRIDTEK